jgi:hypothetical protein
MLESIPATQLWPLVSPLLSDSSRGVRIRAASLLAAVLTASQIDKNSSMPRRSLSRRSASMPIGPKRVPRWVTSSHGADFQATLKLNTRPRFA